MEDMGGITGIEAQKRNKARVSVFVDGQFLGGLDKMVWARSGLKAGDRLTQELWQDLICRGERQAALDRALGHLSARARSRAEIERYLGDKGFSEDAARYAVGRLEEYGYINDSAFAGMLVRDRMSLKNIGKKTLAQELKRMGIAEEEAASALGQYGEDEELAAAMRQAQKDMKRTAGEADSRKRRAKVYASLARRGFTRDVIEAALARSFSDLPDDGW